MRVGRGHFLLGALVMSWLPVLGCSKGDSEVADQDGVRQGVKAGVTASDLRTEVTVPHLWATVKAVSVKSGRLAVAVHIERAGGLEPVKVSQFDIAMRALGQLALRTKDAEPVLLQYIPARLPRPHQWSRITFPCQFRGLTSTLALRQG